MTMASIRHDTKTFQHSALKHPRRAIRLCKFVPSRLRSHIIELEIAHYTLDNVGDSDYIDDDGIVFANFDEDDQVASYLDADEHRQRVRYTAILYCWGESLSTRNIRLRGTTSLLAGISSNFFLF